MSTNNAAPDYSLLPNVRGHSMAVGSVGTFSDSIGVGQFPLEKDPSLHDFLTVLRKRRKLIAFLFLGALGTAWVYCLLSPKLYTATSSLEIKGYAPVITSATVENAYSLDTRKLEYQKTTIAKLKRVGTAEAVLENTQFADEVRRYLSDNKGVVGSLLSGAKNLIGLNSTPVQEVETEDPDKKKGAFVRKYLSLLEISPVHETSLVEISATTADPDLSRKIANEHAKGFIERVQNERKDTVNSTLKALQQQADELKNKVSTAERRLAGYAEENALVTISKSGDDNPVTKQIAELTKLLIEAQGRRIKTESVVREIEGADVAESTALDDELIRDARVKLVAAETEYAALGQKVTPAYPGMIELKAKINVAKKTIEERRKALIRQLQTQLKSELSAERKLREQISKEEGRAHEVSKKLIQYTELQREVDSLQGLYQAVLKQLEETGVGSATGASNIVVSDYAQLPSSPSAPLTELIIAIGGLLGLVGGVALAFVLELLDNTLGTSEEVQASLNTPFLGGIPTFSNTGKGYFKQEAIIRLGTLEVPESEKVKEENAPATVVDRFVTIASPHAAVSESLRTIRAAILLSSADNPSRVVMVTSANKGEGKTTVASNLAVTLAQASHRTLLIDGDLRQSTIHKLFNIPEDQPGLVDYLAGQAPIESCLLETSVANLDILTSGSKTPNPAELIGSNKMRQLMESLKERYDYILIDTPPVVPVADALLLSKIADSVIVVVRSLHTEKTSAQEATRRLQRVGAKILGVVLNDVDMEKIGYSTKRIANSYYYGV